MGDDFVDDVAFVSPDKGGETNRVAGHLGFSAGAEETDATSGDDFVADVAFVSPDKGGETNRVMGHLGFPRYISRGDTRTQFVTFNRKMYCTPEVGRLNHTAFVEEEKGVTADQVCGLVRFVVWYGATTQLFDVPT